MSVHTSHSRHNIGSLEVSSSQKISASSGLVHSSRLELHLKADMSECENHDPFVNAGSKTIDINSTYVISACKKTRETPVTSDPRRLSLQRRATCGDRESSLLGSELGNRRTADTSLRLQRRHGRADYVGKWETLNPVGGNPGSDSASQASRTEAKGVNNDTRVLSSVVSVKDSNDTGLTRCKDPGPPVGASNEKVTVKDTNSRAPVGSQRQTEAMRSGHLVVQLTESKSDTPVSGGRNSHRGNAGKDTAKQVGTFGSSDTRTPVKCVLEHRWTPRHDPPPPKSPALSTPKNNGKDIPKHGSTFRSASSESRTPVKCVPEHRWTPRHDLPPPKSPALSTLKNRIASPRVKPRPKSSLFANKRESSRESTLPPEENSLVQKTFTEPDSLKVENSQVTVAVRVRPFSKREKTEKASQVVFTNGEEITVEHPDMKQVYSFIYDVSFWSFDECHPGYASQTTVYETLAAPLLDRAFEGYNTCLFAYGQTGSGKSYTMMGLNEEPGIIPRFCEDLFAQIAKKQTSEVSYHLEMSFFEVYNEKIHDLLVCKGENGQRKQPLRAREHPVSGPYVEGLSMNVVSSYSDIQSWLELGNKQRATAATGMNDKSSRSHSVFTLVMTQTKAIKRKPGWKFKNSHDCYRQSRCQQHRGNAEHTQIRHPSPPDSQYRQSQRGHECKVDQRVWKEKFEQAEKRKLQETKELQTEVVEGEEHDHRITSRINLVDLAGSERCSTAHSSGQRLKEGVSINKSLLTLGKVISALSEQANGKRVFIPYRESTLTWGDRVVLGGDHYFRFNHPVEVQKGKKLSSRNNLTTSEGPKDFEFAKNELLTAQRSRLEAEIKDAQLKAKEEMMQGIQIAKEMAQQELSSQKAVYERKIQALEAELREESQRKRLEELNNQKASHKIEELERAKQHLEQEVYVNKRRLEMETLATKQALEDHRIRHARILEALEIEKQKIAEEVQMLQENRGNRDKTFTIQPNWNSMKLSTMIQEANAISDKFKKCYIFGRHDASDKGRSDTSVRVRNLQLGISTFWSLEKFESKLAAMKELYESNGGDRDEDVFCDPADEWEPDITSTPVSSLSRRRSRSLMKNRRVSGCLHDIHPIQSMQSSHSSGLMEKPSTIYSNSSESFLPGICKELIGSSIDFLGQSFDEEKTIADSLINNLLRLHNGVIAISKAHEEQDEESQDNLFSDRAAQALTIQVACAFEQLVVLFKHWLGDFLPCTGSARLEDELRQDIKKLGGYLQLFLQGCCSDISSMVKEAQNKVMKIIQQAVQCVGQLAVLKGSKLCVLENSSKVSSTQEFMAALQDGVTSGMKSLLDSGLETAQDLRQDLSRQSAREELLSDYEPPLLGYTQGTGNSQVPQSKYAELLAIIEELGKEVRLTYAGSKSAMERLKRGIIHAQSLVRECLAETERNARSYSLVTKQMKASTVEWVGSLENAVAEWRTKSFRTQAQEGSRQQVSKLLSLASEFLKLKSCLQQTVEMIVSALRGCPSDLHCLRSCTETICSLARKLHSDFSAHSASAGSCGNELPRADCEELESLAKSLLLCFECGESPGLSKPWESCSSNSKEEQCKSDRADCGKSGPRRACEPHGDATPAVSSGDCTPNRIQWV
ncbi:mCG142634 [Mus musculus]|nr:mCG142634 [Mus musculus]